MSLDVRELHGENVATAVEKLTIHDQRDGEATRMPGGHAGLKFLQDLETYFFDDNCNVEVRLPWNKIDSGGASIQSDGDQLFSEQLTKLVGKVRQNFFDTHVKHTLPRYGSKMKRSIRPHSVKVNADSCGRLESC